MQKFIGGFLIIVVFLVLRGDYLFHSGEYIPKAAEEAIIQSQGQIIVRIPNTGGETNSALGQAFLVSADGMIMTAAHIFQMAGDIDEIAKHPEWVSFNIYTSRELDFPKTESSRAKLIFWSEVFDVAILTLEKVPEGMKPVRFASSVYLYDQVYAQVRGYSHDKMLLYFDSLPFQGTIVERPLAFALDDTNKRKSLGYVFFYLDKSFKSGFSVAMMVNGSGDVVGMGEAISGGFSIIISAPILKTILAYVKEKINKDSK